MPGIPINAGIQSLTGRGMKLKLILRFRDLNIVCPLAGLAAAIDL